MNNTFTINNMSNNYDITIPNGNYDGEDLASNVVINSGGRLSGSSYDKDTNSITFDRYNSIYVLISIMVQMGINRVSVVKQHHMIY